MAFQDFEGADLEGHPLTPPAPTPDTGEPS
nr:MAG TPA: hypothetical protein [Caudoviricetes sp.]